MISDKERREAAENLRYLSDGNRVRYKEEFFELLDETVMEPDTGYHEMNDVFDRLADLIDRPTCHISETDHEFEDSVRCDRCQMTFNRPWEPFKFCPSCGAEVVK